MAGFSAATALGSPIGAVVGGVGDWRWTMVLVSVLGGLSGLGIWAFLADIPLPPKVTLRQRLAPLADVRAGLLLMTTLIAMAGTFTVYNYFAVAFDRAIAGDAYVLGGLLAAWGVAGTAANLFAGRLIDRADARKVVQRLLIALVLVVGTLPFTSAHLWSAAIAVAVWGGLGWGVLVPQQHRLVSLAPSIAPVLLGLNTAGTYLGVTTAGVIGAAGVNALGAHALGFIGAALIVVALVFSELAARRAAATQRDSTVEV
ncbi:MULTISPECIES: MFS transporter [unclassified Duganella]|uniref:MFS transporter n=1 Tax=unclassified Duganella TaxID=2636909 RepID=UPI0008872F00|nr:MULTISPECIES: MFS transporter [unclassified Duganella]SDF97177.1 Major Facilitator Superfamily protein [Duganella sp. OV458]SDJ07501.1 Major Facilitator Superfamily protein [Duganella sp. OV510]